MVSVSSPLSDTVRVRVRVVIQMPGLATDRHRDRYRDRQINLGQAPTRSSFEGDYDLGKSVDVGSVVGSTDRWLSGYSAKKTKYERVLYVLYRAYRVGQRGGAPGNRGPRSFVTFF